MRILQINSVCGTGSTGRIATDIYDILKENGHECCIAYGRGDAPAGYNTIKIGNKYDIYYHALMNRITDKHGFYSGAATKKFIKQVEEYNPDVIHIHNIHGYYINIEILFSYLKQSNKPVILTLHDCWSFTGHCAYFTYVGCDKWKYGCYECPQLETYPRSIFFDGSKGNYQKKKQLFTGFHNLTIVTPSKWLAGLVKESYLGEYPVKVINNGIDTDIFKPTESDFRSRYGLENKYIILGVANIWDKRKGLDDFIELSKQLDDKSQAIVLVGLSEKQLKTLPKNIIGIKRTNSIKELAEIYTAANIFFNPTYEDNYPTVNLEAQACGTFVVTYDVGGSLECLLSDVQGAFINKKDYQVLLSCMKINITSRNVSHGLDKHAKLVEYVSLYEHPEYR